MSEQLITQEVLAQLAAAVAEEVPMAELVAGGVTQKTLSYRVDTFQRQITKLVNHFSNSVRDLARPDSSCLCPKQENSFTPFQRSMLVHSYEVMSGEKTLLAGQDIFAPAPSAPQATQKSILKRRHFFSCYLGLSVKDDIKFIILCCSSDFKYFF